MKIEKIVAFPTQLVHVETTRIAADKKVEEVEKTFNITANTKGMILDKKTGKSVIDICVSNETFSIEVEKVGIFEFEAEIKDEHSATIFLETQAVRILWSYVREDIYSVSSKMLPRPIMLPTIDVMKTIEKAQ